MANLNGNGITKKDVLNLLGKHSIREIESGLVSIYCKKSGFNSVKNNLIGEMLEKSKSNVEQSITDFLERKTIDLNTRTIEKMFELLLAPEERKVNGAYYTPDFLLEYITNHTVTANSLVCDPACGSGAFLSYAVKRLAKLEKTTIIDAIENSVYGADILESGIRRTKIILTLIALEHGEDKKEIKFNLYEGDSLTLDWHKQFPSAFKHGGFDAVIGNPPYVRARNLPVKLREKIHATWATAGYGNSDLFIPFVELGITLINDTGNVGFVLPNGYATSLSAKRLRELLQNRKLLNTYVDFNHLQIFQGATTYVCVTILGKEPRETFNYTLIDDPKFFSNISSSEFTKIITSSLNANSWRFLNPLEKENIRKIETAGRKLEKLTKIRTGIATLRNSLFVLPAPKSEGSYLITEFDGKQYRIEKAITREIIHAGHTKSAEEVERNTARIIFPYRVIGSKAYELIGERELKDKYPQCYAYLFAIRPELELRDKGRKKYASWYAYGRTQGIIGCFGNKLLVPTIYGKPHFVPCYKPQALVYSGYEICYSGNLEALGKVLNSKVMWYYIKKTSKRYAGGYMSFAKNFIKSFSVVNLTLEEQKYLEAESDENKINRFLIKKYGLNLDGFG